MSATAWQRASGIPRRWRLWSIMTSFRYVPYVACCVEWKPRFTVTYTRVGTQICVAIDQHRWSLEAPTVGDWALLSTMLTVVLTSVWKVPFCTGGLCARFEAKWGPWRKIKCTPTNALGQNINNNAFSCSFFFKLLLLFVISQLYHLWWIKIFIITVISSHSGEKMCTP